MNFRTVKRSKDSTMFAVTIEEGIPAVLVSGSGPGSYERNIDACRKAMALVESSNAARRDIERRHLLQLRAKASS